MLGPFGKKISPDLLLFSPTSNGVPQLQKSARKTTHAPSYHKPLSNDVSLWTREHANNNPQLSIFAVVFTPSKSMPSCTSKVQCIQWGHSVPDRKPTSWQHRFESSLESEPLTAIVFDMFFHLRQNPETETDSAHLKKKCFCDMFSVHHTENFWIKIIKGSWGLFTSVEVGQIVCQKNMKIQSSKMWQNRYHVVLLNGICVHKWYLPY